MSGEKKLTDVVNDFKTASSAAGLKQFDFDEMSSINQGKEDEFPRLLFKPPKGRNVKADLSEKDWEIDMFVFDVWKILTDDHRSLQQVWQEMEDLGRKTLKEIMKDRLYGFVSPNNEPLITYGYPIANDMLVGVRFQFTVRAYYEC